MKFCEEVIDIKNEINNLTDTDDHEVKKKILKKCLDILRGLMKPSVEHKDINCA